MAWLCLIKWYCACQTPYSMVYLGQFAYWNIGVCIISFIVEWNTSEHSILFLFSIIHTTPPPKSACHSLKLGQKTEEVACCADRLNSGHYCTLWDYLSSSIGRNCFSMSQCSKMDLGQDKASNKDVCWMSWILLNQLVAKISEDFSLASPSPLVLQRLQSYQAHGTRVAWQSSASAGGS